MAGNLGGEFCLVCGADPPLYGERMCEPCIRKRIKLVKVPENIPWVRCARCGIVEIQGKWVQISEEEIWDELIQRHVHFHKDAEDIGLALETRTVSDRHTLLHLQVEGVIEDLLFKEEHTMRARMANGVCLTCTRRAGNYFEATVQLRSTGRRLSEEEFTALRATLDKVLEELADDPMFFITKEGIVTGGWDLQLGSKSMARSWARLLTKKFGGTVKETSTVVGMRDGIEITRLTVSYRKPAYDVGDVVKLNNDLWMIDSWQKDGPIIRRLKFFHRTGASWRDMEKARIICSRSEQFIVDILNRDSSAAEVMTPHDYTMTTVALPYDDDKNLTKLRIGFIEDIWVALPGFVDEGDT